MKIVGTREELEQLREKCRVRCTTDCVLYDLCKSYPFVRLTQPEMATFMNYIDEHSYEYINIDGQWIHKQRAEPILITNKKE